MDPNLPSLNFDFVNEIVEKIQNWSILQAIKIMITRKVQVQVQVQVLVQIKMKSKAKTGRIWKISNASCKK